MLQWKGKNWQNGFKKVTELYGIYETYWELKTKIDWK